MNDTPAPTIEALLAEVERQRLVIRQVNSRCDHLGMSLRAIKAERDALRAQRLHWVPVSERLPDDDITVICWLEPGGEWFSGWHADGRWHDAASGGRMEGVTHWADPVGPND